MFQIGRGGAELTPVIDEVALLLKGAEIVLSSIGRTLVGKCVDGANQQVFSSPFSSVEQVRLTRPEQRRRVTRVLDRLIWSPRTSLTVESTPGCRGTLGIVAVGRLS